MAAEAREGVANHVGLDRELTAIANVRVEGPAAEWIAAAGPAIRRRLDDLTRDRVCHPALGLFDPRAHTLSGDGAAHEDDLTEMARDHAAAGGGLLDRELDLLSLREAHG